MGMAWLIARPNVTNIKDTFVVCAVETAVAGRTKFSVQCFQFKSLKKWHRHLVVWVLKRYRELSRLTMDFLHWRR